MVLISKTKFNGLTFFIQKWIVNDYARTHGSYIGDDARRLALENQENMSEELLLPDCYQYLVSTTQKQTILSDRDKTITGKIVVPSSDTVTNAEYFTGNIQRRISDGAYFLTNRSGTSNPASDWNWYVTSTGAVSSSTSGIGEMAGLAAIFTLR